jgi:hypothetical protein
LLQLRLLWSPGNDLRACLLHGGGIGMERLLLALMANPVRLRLRMHLRL